MKQRRMMELPSLIEKAQLLQESWVLEGVHYMKRCSDLALFRSTNRLSERDVAGIFNISKSEVHRMIQVGQTDQELRVAVVSYGTDYHALSIYHGLKGPLKTKLRSKLISGEIFRHIDAKEFSKRGFHVSGDLRTNKRFNKVLESSELNMEIVTTMALNRVDKESLLRLMERLDQTSDCINDYLTAARESRYVETVGKLYE